MIVENYSYLEHFGTSTPPILHDRLNILNIILRKLHVQIWESKISAHLEISRAEVAANVSSRWTWSKVSATFDGPCNPPVASLPLEWGSGQRVFKIEKEWKRRWRSGTEVIASRFFAAFCFTFRISLGEAFTWWRDRLVYCRCSPEAGSIGMLLKRRNGWEFANLRNCRPFLLVVCKSLSTALVLSTWYLLFASCLAYCS